MALTPEYKQLIAREVAARQTPYEQFQHIAKQNAMANIRGPQLEVNARIKIMTEAR